MRAGTGVGGEEFGALRKNVAHGNGGGAVAIPSVILEEENSARLSGLLVDKSETVIAVAGEEFESDKGVVGELLLPAGAGNGETRLAQAASGKHELAGDGTEDDDRSRGIVKGVELLLVKGLADDGEIERGVIDAPAEGEFGAVVGKRQEIGGSARLGHGAMREAVPIGTQAGLEDEAFRDCPGVLRIGTGLGVGKAGIRKTGKRGLANESSVGAECLDFGALGGLRIEHTGEVGPRSELMGSVPMARGRSDACDGLQAASALMQALKIVARGAVDEQNVGLSALRGVIEHAAVGSDAEFEKRVVEPQLIFQ